MNELYSKAALIAAGMLIGWLLRWKRDKYYFEAIAEEVKKIRLLFKIYAEEEK